MENFPLSFHLLCEASIVIPLLRGPRIAIVTGSWSLCCAFGNPKVDDGKAGWNGSNHDVGRASLEDRHSQDGKVPDILLWILWFEIHIGLCCLDSGYVQQCVVHQFDNLCVYGYAGCI